MSEVTSNFPQLRFPDFDDKWEEKRLSDIAEKSNVKNRDNEVSSVFTNSATKGVVNQRDFFDKDIANQNNLDGYYIINHDNFVYNPRISFSAPVGPLNRNHLGTGVMSPLYTILKINNVSLDFIERYFKTTKWHRYMNNIANIGARHDRMNIISSDFMKMPIPLPKDEEQQKIAAFLTAFDTKIEQLSKKQELLGEYKKGAMQQIFSQATRFKADDGSNFPDWEEVKLGNLTHKVGKKNKENIKYPIYSINNQEGFRPQSEQFDGLDSNDRGYDISLYKIVNEKTFAYNPARINVGSIGYSYNLNKVIVSSLYVCFKTNDELEDLYLLAYLDTDKFNKDILRYEEGGVRQYLFYENFSQISIPLPGNDEQAKISNFLSSIDNKIEQVDKQLDESKQFKKALLQQMFV